MCAYRHQHSECSAQRLIEPEKRMRSQPREESASAFALKASRNRLRGDERAQGESCHQKRVLGKQSNGPEHLRSEFRPTIDKGLNESDPRIAVCAERSLRRLKIALQNNRRAVVERMRNRRGRMNPLQPVIPQGQRREKRRPRGQRMYCPSECA